MRALVVLCFVALGSARPQAYNYQFGQQQQLQQQHHHHNQQAQTSFGPRPDHIALPAHVTITPPPAVTSGTNDVALQSFNNAAPAPQPTGTHSTGFVNSQSALQQQTIVTKRFYLHSGADDDLQNDEAFQPGPVRKHYRVLFIKAPSGGDLAGLLKASKPKEEEKTVIYVLNKKTDVSEFKNALDAQQQPPTKPEVFFIKYKTPEEALHAQHEIQAQYDALGGTSEVSDEGLAPVQSFIGSVSPSEDPLPVHSNQYLPPTF